MFGTSRLGTTQFGDSGNEATPPVLIQGISSQSTACTSLTEKSVFLQSYTLSEKMCNGNIIPTRKLLSSPSIFVYDRSQLELRRRLHSTNEQKSQITQSLERIVFTEGSTDQLSESRFSFGVIFLSIVGQQEVLQKTECGRHLNVGSEASQQLIVRTLLRRIHELSGQELGNGVSRSQLRAVLSIALFNEQEELFHGVMNRPALIASLPHQESHIFARFAIIPDTSNDRLVVVFGEARKVVIPKQEEL